jgi:hypothetical protein
LEAGDLASLEARWKTCLDLRGRQVVAECVKDTIYGRLVDVTFSGLELEIQGKKVRLAPEAVRHLKDPA